MSNDLHCRKQVVTDFEGHSASEHLKHNHAERVNICSRRDGSQRHVNLFWSHIRRRSHHEFIMAAKSNVIGFILSGSRDSGNSKVNNVHHSLFVHEQISRLQIEMEDLLHVDHAKDVANIQEHTHWGR